jgi:hypothetical protein
LEFRKCLARCFFFVEAQREISTKYKQLYKRSTIDEIKAGVEKLNDSFGWYLTLKSLAESGIFNRPDLTPLESAEQANLYEAYTFLSARSAEVEYQNNLNQVLSKKK